MQIRDTRYARTPDGVYLAYQVAGEGSIDLAWGFDFTGNVDLAWEWPLTGPLLRALARSCRLILHDRRGTGLSSRNVPAPNLETRMSDLRLVLDRVGSEFPVLGGINEAASRSGRRFDPWERFEPDNGADAGACIEQPEPIRVHDPKPRGFVAMIGPSPSQARSESG